MKNLNEKTFDLLEKTGLNWTVKKEELISTSGHETESFGIFRSDNEKWLGTVGSRYTPFQNYELAELVLQAAEGAQVEVTRGGLLYAGQKTFLQAALPSELIGNSQVNRWITALNSHDGSTSIGFGSTNTVVICQNTFYKAFGDLEKVRHTASAKERLEVMIRDLRAAIGLDVQLMENFKRMADMPLKDEAIERVIRKIFQVSTDQKQSVISSRKKNQIGDFAGSLQKSVSEQGSTIWALFNGVTRYTNHVSAPKEKDKKQDYLMANGGAELANIGYDEIMKWITENTASKFSVLV